MNADYEEMLLGVTDVLKAHNRYHMNTPDHEQAVKLIREIVTPRGKWKETGYETGALGITYRQTQCSNCGWEHTLPMWWNFCPNCGARMEV